MGDAPPVIRTPSGWSGTVICLVGAAALLSAAVLFFFDPSKAGVYPQCFFKLSTGLDCPGCGGLRATHQLLHGHVREAFRLNPLFILSLPMAAFFVGRLACERILGRRWPRLLRPTTTAWICGGTVLAFGVLRNLPWRAWLGN